MSCPYDLALKLAADGEHTQGYEDWTKQQLKYRHQLSRPMHWYSYRHAQKR